MFPPVARALAPVLAVVALLPTTAAGRMQEPRLTVVKPKLEAALRCYGDVGRGDPQPVVFATGTGSDASQVYALGRGAFEALGVPLCTVAFPNRTTADVQVSVQYLVYGIRRVAKRARQPVALVGISQGGLLARIALTYWPSVRPKVSDVLTAAATHHGANIDVAACAAHGCSPAVWQQAVGSNFLRALNNGRDETPGRRTAWTTTRSVTDEVVQPQTGPNPTSSLDGAANILIQDVCPGRQTSHIGTIVDSVTVGALADAVTHKGPARVDRIPPEICAHPYGTGLDEQQTALFLDLGQRLLAQGLATVPRVRKEPKVRSWVKRPS